MGHSSTFESNLLTFIKCNVFKLNKNKQSFNRIRKVSLLLVVTIAEDSNRYSYEQPIFHIPEMGSTL